MKTETDDIKATEEILKKAIELLAINSSKEAEIREKSKGVYGRMLDAHMMVTGVIANSLMRKQLIHGKTSESISGRLCLLASFIQGIDICEKSISQGLYTQATALLKQEMETIAAINEYENDERKDRKTPNVKSLKWGLSTLYGELNKIAHVADQYVFNPLFQTKEYGDLSPVSFNPVFNKQFARRLYGLHVALLIQAADCLQNLNWDMYEEKYTEDECRLVVSAFNALYYEGWLVEDKDYADAEWPKPKIDESK